MSNVPELEWHSCSSENMDGMGLGAMIEGSGPRNIVIRVGRGNGQDDDILKIDDRHALYHPLAYVLLFPMGTGGWASVLTRSHRDGSLPGASDGREEFAIGRTNHAGRQYDLTEAWRQRCSALIWPGDLFIGESRIQPVGTA